MHEGLGTFLDAVDEEVLPLGVGERLRVTQLYVSRDPRLWSTQEGEDELGAALASLLAQDEFQWRHIAGLYQRHVAGQGQVVPEEPLRPAPPPRPAQRSPGARPRLPLRARLEPWLKTLGVLAPTWGLLWLACWLLRPETPRLVKPETFAEAKSPGQTPVTEELTQRFDSYAGPQSGPKRITLRAPLRPQPLSGAAFLRLGGLSFLFLFFGLRFVRLRRRQRQSALTQRERLRRVQLNRGLVQRPTYRTPGYMLVSTQVVEDTATILGRLYREDRGVDLDIDGTVRETVRAGGRVVPLFAARRARRTLLLLIDEEQGGYPLLAPFWRLVHTWRRLGVDLVCLRYGHRPTQNLFAEGGCRPQDLQQVLHQHEEAALILFSRLRLTHGLNFDDGWIDELSLLPLRVWLDPDPRIDDEREPEERHAARRVAQAGLARFSFTPQGVTAMARFLAADGIALVAPPVMPLLPLSDSRVQAAVCGWAQAAATVPDASWDQLEEFRRSLPSLSLDLPDPRYVQRLVEWLLPQTGGVAESGDHLCLSKALQDELLRCGRREVGGLTAKSREGEARRLLLEQLEGEEPQDPLQRWYWRLAQAKHQALIEPHYAARRFEAFLGSPVEEEALDFLRVELARQDENPVLPKPVQAELAMLCGQWGGVPVRSVLIGDLRGWQGSALLAGLGTAGLLILMLGMSHLPLRKFQGELPGIVVLKEVERSRLATVKHRTELVESFPGTITTTPPTPIPSSVVAEPLAVRLLIDDPLMSNSDVLTLPITVDGLSGPDEPTLRVEINGREANATVVNVPEVAPIGQLRHGEWSIRVVAPLTDYVVRVTVTYHGRRAFSSPVRVLRYAPPKNTSRLYVVAVGVSSYSDAPLKLNFAAKDAEDFITALRNVNNERGEIFSQAEFQLRTNALATREAVLASMDWLQRHAKAEDVAVMFVAGLGIQEKQTGNVYFLPYDADMANLSTTAILQSEFAALRLRVAGKLLLFLDACPQVGSGPLSTNFLRIPSSKPLSHKTVIFTSSSDTQSTIDSKFLGNGAFTKAVVEGLQGRGDYNDSGAVTIRELELYVSERVRMLTSGRQSPVFWTDSMADFPISAVKQSRAVEKTNLALSPVIFVVGACILVLRIRRRRRSQP